jgi:hypothetical protein
MMTAGRKPTGTPSVWVQEWFDRDRAPHFRVGQKDRPWAAVIEFSASVPETQRDKALALNAKCFVQFNGCKDAADILPGIWELEAPISGYLSPESSDPTTAHAAPEIVLPTLSTEPPTR